MFDNITLSILWSRLISIVDEAGTTLQRTSFSTVTRESADFAVVLMDTKGQSVAQSSVSVPSFLGVLPFLMKSLLKDHFPSDTWQEGDVVITNDPWLCAGHKPDIGIVSPIFIENTEGGANPKSKIQNPKSLIGFIGCIAHSPDIGGALWGAGARDFYEEGLYIPPSKLYTEGVANQTLFRIIETNVRAAVQTVGDIRAQVAANDQGIRSLIRMMQENGLTELDPLADQIITASEKAMREAIRQAPNGTYRFEYDADGDALKNPVKFKIALTIADDSIAVDYDGTSPAHPLAINAVLNYVFAYTAYPIKCVFSPDVPNNEGAFRPITVTAPEGCLLNAKKPSPLGARHITGNLLHAPVFGALAQAVPDRVQADCGGSVWIMVLSGRRDNGDEFVEYIMLAAGTGARATMDGIACLHFPTNVANVPIEVLENDCPVLVTRKALARGSGGKGKFTGGDGQVFSFKNIGQQPLNISIITEKTKTQAYGLFGGASGKSGTAKLSNGRKLPAKGIDKLMPQEELILTFPGAGGMVWLFKSIVALSFNRFAVGCASALFPPIASGVIHVQSLRDFVRVSLYKSLKINKMQRFSTLIFLSFTLFSCGDKPATKATEPTAKPMTVTPFIFDNGPDYVQEGLFRITEGEIGKGGKMGFANENNQAIITARFTFALPFQEGLAAFCMDCQKEIDGEHWRMTGGKWGFVDKTGQEVIPPQYDAANSFENGQAMVIKDGKQIVINHKGEVVKNGQ